MKIKQQTKPKKKNQPKREGEKTQTAAVLGPGNVNESTLYRLTGKAGGALAAPAPCDHGTKQTYRLEEQFPAGNCRPAEGLGKEASGLPYLAL